MPVQQVRIVHEKGTGHAEDRAWMRVQVGEPKGGAYSNRDLRGQKRHEFEDKWLTVGYAKGSGTTGQWATLSGRNLDSRVGTVHICRQCAKAVNAYIAKESGRPDEEEEDDGPPSPSPERDFVEGRGKRSNLDKIKRGRQWQAYGRGDRSKRPWPSQWTRVALATESLPVTCAVKILTFATLVPTVANGTQLSRVLTVDATKQFTVTSQAGAVLLSIALAALAAVCFSCGWKARGRFKGPARSTPPYPAKVCLTPKGGCYHLTAECPTLHKSQHHIVERELCGVCVPVSPVVGVNAEVRVDRPALLRRWKKNGLG